MKPIHMPALGVGQTEGTLLGWYKQPGDLVAAGEPVAEIETDKSAMDLESPADGWLGRQLVEPGSVVPVGTVLGELREEGDDDDAAPTPEVQAPAVKSSADVEPRITPAGSADQRPEPSGRQPHALSPRQRRILAESAASNDLVTVGGDPVWARGRHRAAIGRLVSDAWATIPHYAVVRDIDAGPLLSNLTKVRRETPETSITDLLLRSLGIALHAHGVAKPVALGLAVATPDGVVVPVVEDTTGSLVGVADRRRGAVARARAGRLSTEDLDARPVATLSNLGTHGVNQFTGIIGSGQVALLTIGRIAPRPAVAADRTLVVSDLFTATLNVDHRAIDGDVAAGILGAFASACGSLDEGAPP